MADAPTLVYHDQLTHFLSPLPRLSSSIALSASTSITTPSITSCPTCHAETIGGFNSSYRLIKGKLWSACEGCGAVGTRGGGSAAGKAKFESVRKRSKMERSLPYPLSSRSGAKATGAVETTPMITIPTTTITTPPLALATPPSIPDVPSITTKRAKRAKKQPSGLAFLLEAKRKEKEVKVGTKLEDFLARI